MSLRDLFLKGKVSDEYARVTNGGLDVNIQDQHTPALDAHFVQVASAQTTLSVATVVDDTDLTLTSVAGFVDGTFIAVVIPAGRATFLTQLGAPVGNVVSVDSPLDYAYPIGTVVLNLTRDMNVNGSVTAQIFQIGPSSVDLDITRIMGYMESSSSMDDSKFGSLTALTKGCVLRANNGEVRNQWNVKTNNDLALIGFDFEYPTKVPTGVYSARFRITYGGQEKHGVTIRLLAGETLQLILQDNLTGLDVFNMMAQGHEVE